MSAKSSTTSCAGLSMPEVLAISIITSEVAMDETALANWKAVMACVPNSLKNPSSMSRMPDWNG